MAESSSLSSMAESSSLFGMAESSSHSGVAESSSLSGMAESLIANMSSSDIEQACEEIGMSDDLQVLKVTMLSHKVKGELLMADQMQAPFYAVRLNHILSDAENLLDEVLLSYGSRSTKTKVGSFFSNYNPLGVRYRMVRQIKDIRKRLDKAVSDRHMSGLRINNMFRRKRKIASSLTMNDSDVVGREHDKEKIIELLMQPCTCDDDLSLSVLPIVGMGGMGKTTLAKLVYNDTRIEECFTLKMWVCVSLDFNFEEVIIDILASTYYCYETYFQRYYIHEDLKRLIHLLRKALAGEKFLLVLDDVWDDDPLKWAKLRNLIPTGMKGSKILVTTRRQSISSMMGTIPSHVLEGLSLNDSLSLLKKWVFKEGEEEKYPDLVEVGREIVKKCGGVPLAIRTIRSMLYSKRGIHEWVAVRDNEIWNMPQKKDDILAALKLSYDNMPFYLKQCFAMFSLYPNDFIFHNSEVTSLWAALGLLPSPKDNESFTDVANQCLYDLKSRFFLRDFVNFGTSCYFKIHDLVHNLAFCVAKDECLVVNSNIKKTPEYVQHLSFVENGFLDKSFTPSYVGVRTILFPIEGMGASSKAFLNMCVSSYKYLRILDLSDSTYETLPQSVGKLRHLRFLSLERNEKIKRVPDSISKLPNLQVLNLVGCTELEKLPKGLTSLIRLRQLGITTKESALPEHDIANLNSLEILNIESCNNLKSFSVGIKFPTLKTLTVTNCGSLKSLPLDINHFPQLDTLLVDNCGDLELANGLDDKKSSLRLKAIRLHSLPRLVNLPCWLQESTNTLQSLLIVDCKNFEMVPEWLSTLSFLESIGIVNCPKLMSLPNDVHHLTRLEYLRIEGCPDLCRKCQPRVGEYWPKISPIKQIFVDEPEDLKEEPLEEEE